MPERLIDANKLPEHYLPLTALGDHMITYDYDIDAAPTVDAVRVVHGKWDADPCGWHCSECGADGRSSWHYCPNCGAKMDGEKGEKE